MVKTRHSGDTDADSPPTFISLANERSRRALKAADPAAAAAAAAGGGGGGVVDAGDRAYRDTPDAYNIFEDKIVESRLRPRIGPSRAYNYIEVDSSDEEIIRRRHRHLPLQEYSPDRRRSRYSRSRQINEMLDKQEQPRRTLRRQVSPHEDMEEDQTTEEEEDDDSGVRRTRRQRNSLDDDDDSGVRRTRRQRNSLDDEDDDGENDEKTTRNRSSRLHLSADHHEEDTNRGSRSLRRRTSCSTQDEVVSSHNLRQRPAAEDDEHLIRRSSRTRRQVYDTLNQSYLVSIPGRSRHSSGDNNSDNKDQDSDDDNKQFSDMYSRVKRKRVSVKRNMYGVPVMGDSDSEQDAGKSDQNKDDDDDEEDNCEEDDEEEAEDSMKNVDDSSNQRMTRQRNHSLHKKQQQQPQVVKSYSLREHKPRTDLYKAPIEERRNKRIHNSIFVSTVKKSISQTYHSPAHKRKIRKRSAFHSSSSSTSSDSDEKSFNLRKTKSMDKARSRMMPMNFDLSALRSANTVKDRVKAGASLADIEPMSIDRNITFNSIGGLGKHIRALKEMIVFPLLYDEVFQRFKVDPPRGVLFYGPPGTGKTLVARALANECSKGDRRVAFFMRKGADCLSKWVGESERQLRLLFDQAYRYRPSIIFFDEIDGLAPVRSSRQDQIHSSIVSTLLALMDGLDSRGEIVVIGATNRIDSLDPALRRPGRFDREFLFDLPSLEARKQILKIHTSAWNPKLNDCFLSELAEKCVGYCGADLKSLCTEAAMLALRRRYPQIYVTNEALQLDVSSIHVSAKDFFNAVNSIIPTSQRAVHTPAHALPARIRPLLHQQLVKVMSQLSEIYPYCQTQAAAQGKTGSSQVYDTSEAGVTWDEFASDEDDDAPSIYERSTSSKGSRKHSSSEDVPNTAPTYLNFLSSASSRPVTFRPRLLIAGKGGQGQSTYLAPAILHRMEHLRVHVLDLPTLYAVTAKTPEESCTNVFHEAKRKCPSVIYMPYINQWWEVMGETVRATLLTLVQHIDPMIPLLLLATSEQPYHMLDPGLRSLFGQLSDEVVHMANPSSDERRAFFHDLLLTQAVRPPPQKKQAAQRMLETLPRAAPPKPRELTKDELAQLVEKEELTLMELRIFLRDVLNKLGSDKKFSIFAKPVNIEDAADYYQIIEHPMDLSTMMSKIDLHEYNTVRTFMQDIDLICSNALEYNPNRGPMDRIIRHRACALKDTAYAIIKTDLDKEFEKTCMEIEESRKLRGERSTTVPNFYYTRPAANPQQQQQHSAAGSSSNKNPSAVPSYLDNTKPARSIPKPEGERFSRRVRGLNIDPTPPLEAVEKVYKVSRTGNLSVQEQDDDDDCEEEETETACSSSSNNNKAGESVSKEEKMVITSESKVAGVGGEKKAASTAGSSKKKKIVKCVWCKPRRKRPRLSTTYRPPPTTVSHASEEEVEEEEEMVQEPESKKAAAQDSQSHHLVVDVSEQEVSTSETKDMKSPDRMSTRSRSPAYVGPVSSCRISTRRGSLSPRGGTLVAQLSSSDQAETHMEEQTESNRDSTATCGLSSANNKIDSCAEKHGEGAPTGSSSQQHQVTDGHEKPKHPGSDGLDKPKVVKRLDLESVTLDSGVGSSVDSNGDSHDGMDHKGEVEPGSTRAPHFSITQECHENSNNSSISSRALKDKAGVILNEPHQNMVVDVNQLISLLNCLVTRTEGCCVERLDKIYSQLSHVIYRHRQEYDRSAMISELTQRLEQLVKVAASLNTPSTPSSSS